MRYASKLTVALLMLGLLATPALAAPTGADEAQSRAGAYLKTGLRLVENAAAASTKGRQLQLYDKALTTLRRALAVEGIAKKDASLAAKAKGAMTTALNGKARIYLERGSLPQAQEANRAALSYSVDDADALRLHALIHKALLTDVIDEFKGRVAIQRLRARRAQAGAPLRDRGLARRR